MAGSFDLRDCSWEIGGLWRWILRIQETLSVFLARIPTSVLPFQIPSISKLISTRRYLYILFIFRNLLRLLHEIHRSPQLWLRRKGPSSRCFLGHPPEKALLTPDTHFRLPLFLQFHTPFLPLPATPPRASCSRLRRTQTLSLQPSQTTILQHSPYSHTSLISRRYNLIQRPFRFIHQHFII